MSQITRLHKKLRSAMEKAILEYNMIDEGDRVLVGVSGGPDSLSLLKLLHERQIYAEQKASILACHVTMGFEEKGEPSWKALEQHFQNIGVEYRIIHTDISRHALDPDAKKNPCFICSMYRRRKVYELAHTEGCNKIANGHHKDDIVETLLINILYGRKIEAMNPMQEVFQGKIHIIRPLAYVEEELLKKFAVESRLPETVRLCPVDGQTRRQRIKEMIADLQAQEKNANIRENIFKSLRHVNIHFSPK